MEAQVAIDDQKVGSTKMLACEVEGWALEVKKEFQRAKRHADVAMDDVENFPKNVEASRRMARDDAQAND